MDRILLDGIFNKYSKISLYSVISKFIILFISYILFSLVSDNIFNILSSIEFAYDSYSLSVIIS